MDIQKLINEGTNLTLSVRAADLNDFANILIMQTRTETEREIEQRQKEIYYSSDKVENLLSVNNSTLWRWAKRNYLTPVKVGGKNRYRKSDIDKILDQGKSKNK